MKDVDSGLWREATAEAPQEEPLTAASVVVVNDGGGADNQAAGAGPEPRRQSPRTGTRRQKPHRGRVADRTTAQAGNEKVRPQDPAGSTDASLPESIQAATALAAMLHAAATQYAEASDRAHVLLTESTATVVACRLQVGQNETLIRLLYQEAAKLRSDLPSVRINKKDPDPLLGPLVRLVLPATKDADRRTAVRASATAALQHFEKLVGLPAMAAVDPAQLRSTVAEWIKEQGGVNPIYRRVMKEQQNQRKEAPSTSKWTIVISKEVFEAAGRGIETHGYADMKVRVYATGQMVPIPERAEGLQNSGAGRPRRVATRPSQKAGDDKAPNATCAGQLPLLQGCFEGLEQGRLGHGGDDLPGAGREAGMVRFAPIPLTAVTPSGDGHSQVTRQD